MQSKKFLYVTVFDSIKSKIADGVLKGGDWLPSEREIGEEYDVDRTTVRKALDKLVANNLIIKRAGIGSQVVSKTSSSSSSTKSIAFFLPTSIRRDNLLSQPYYASILNRMEKECRKNHYSLIYSTLDSDDDFSKISDGHYAAIVFASNIDHKFIDFAIDNNIPTVLLNAQYDRVISINSDNFNGMKQACEHLISLGHKRFAFITGFEDYLSTNERLNACICVLTKNDISIKDQYIEHNMLEHESGYAVTMKILKSTDKHPTAFVCFNDVVAFGCLQALHEFGLATPEDVSVIGFDGIDQSSYSTPPLTTVQQHVDEITKTAMACLQMQMQNYSCLERSPRISIPCTLTVRESCGPAKD